MRKLMITGAIIASLVMSACKGNGSTDGKSNAGEDSVSQNDGTGAPGSGSGSAGRGTVNDTTLTQQDTASGAPRVQKDTSTH